MKTKYVANPTTIGEQLRNRRLDLGLLIREVATQLGVSQATINSWEFNKVQPNTWHLPRITAFLGLPVVPETSLGVRIKQYRMMKKIQQSELAQQLGISTQRVGFWEQNRSRPQQASLLKRLEEILASGTIAGVPACTMDDPKDGGGTMRHIKNEVCCLGAGTGEAE